MIVVLFLSPVPPIKICILINPHCIFQSLSVKLFCLFLLICSVLYYPSLKMCVHNIPRGTDHLGSTVDFNNVECEFSDYSDTCDCVDTYFTDSHYDLTCIQLNTRGVLSKRSHLISLIDGSIEGKLPDIILLCETWLTPFSLDLNIPGYIFCHLDRKTRRAVE